MLFCGQGKIQHKKIRCKDENNKWSEAQKTKQEADEGKRREEYERTKSIPDKWKMLLISTLRFAPSSWYIWIGLSWWLQQTIVVLLQDESTPVEHEISSHNEKGVNKEEMSCNVWAIFYSTSFSSSVQSPISVIHLAESQSVLFVSIFSIHKEKKILNMIYTKIGNFNTFAVFHFLHKIRLEYFSQLFFLTFATAENFILQIYLHYCK